MIVATTRHRRSRIPIAYIKEPGLPWGSDLPKKSKTKGIDFGDPELPVAGRGSLSAIRPSHRSKWRAAVLIGVHVAIAVHATHFLLAGRTVSPVEPSEAMYTLELGYVNAGFVFFAVALLATLVFGRFFCGWGCHLVALQDFCGWLMKKAGIRPRPFRSRLLLWIPLAYGIYMFVWPTPKRLVVMPWLERVWPAAAQWFGPVAEFQGFSNHLMTDSFWKTFPGPVFAVLTLLTCGFAAVYFLGAKGFCTYGCPYGGFFGVLDQWSPGSIVVDDNCEGCGHCTATCTSNVLVHEEVRLFGKVVDPGCMKCMDCVSVCPNDALSFGWAKPSALTAKKQVERAVRYDLSRLEELSLLGVFFVAVFAFRRLYDGPPLLMAIGLAGITAFVALKAVRLLRRHTVRLQNLELKLGGRLTRSGRVVLVVTVLWLAFTAHSGLVQAQRKLAQYHFKQIQASRADVLSGAFHDRRYPDEHHDAAAASFEHFRAAARWGLIRVPEIELGLAWGHLLRDEVDAAVARIRGVLEDQPDLSNLRAD
ncbi:MAG: 4Fe-4S binding protein, partial [Acidobacteria bacterium]|nr:4Fe-4S binding protein [Acidobacteriota bacterium]NIO60469.1 4Fe-4S binding protein [Acidobacteriota bacterium]NIQ31575.1 4Fe-4S binding protein [Acidobacteriota bacterium]NIQ86825.1 4Fe-4S binding protein [Acidobacteriota bacterium]